MKWNFVEDKLPDTEGEYIVTLYSGEVTAARYNIRGESYWCDIVEEYQEYDVLYWMEMPEAPDIKADQMRIIERLSRQIRAAITGAEKNKADIDTIAVDIKFKYLIEKNGIRFTEGEGVWEICGKTLEFIVLPKDYEFVAYNKKRQDQNIMDQIRNTRYARYL